MPKGLSGYRKHLQYSSPKKQWNQILEILHHKKTDIADKAKEVEALFTEFARHEMSFSAFRIARILSAEYVKAQKIVHSVNKQFQFTHLYGFTPNDPTKLRVYTNFEISSPNEFDLFTDACPYHNTKGIEGVVQKINADMLNPNMVKKWTPLSRGRKLLKKYADVTIEQALIRYTDALKHYPEKIVKEIAGQIEELRMPLELHYAETPEQILYMYSSGPSSCMFVGGKERPWQWMTDIGRHPNDLFAYHPFIRGVYTKIKSKGTVTARVFLYKAVDGKEYYGRIYGTDGRTQTAMKNALDELGLSPIPINGETDRGGQAGSFMRECEFRVPGIEHNNDVFLPVPYMDNLRGGINFKYDKETKEFIVSCYDGSGYYLKEGKKTRYKEFSGYSGMTSGYISSAQAGGGHQCAQCGGNVTSATYAGLAERVTGNRYCGSGCISEAGRVIAVLGNGTQVILPKSEAYYDKHQGMFYTTEEACRERGGLPYEPDPLVREEAPDLTTYGYATGEGYRFRNSRDNDIRRGYGKFNVFNPTKIKDKFHKYLEIDFDKVEGVRFVGTVPDAYINEKVDERYGYPIIGTRTLYHTVKTDSMSPYIYDRDTDGSIFLNTGETNIRRDEEVPVAA